MSKYTAGQIVMGTVTEGMTAELTALGLVAVAHRSGESATLVAKATVEKVAKLKLSKWDGRTMTGYQVDEDDEEKMVPYLDLQAGASLENAVKEMGGKLYGRREAPPAGATVAVSGADTRKIFVAL